MNKVLFGLDNLIQSEQATSALTQEVLRGNYQNFPPAVDVLLKIPYYIGQLEAIDTPKGNCQSTIYLHYVQAPYTFWSIYNLYDKGYYLEALTLYRHLLEVLFQVRYIHKYPERTEAISTYKHFEGKRITFKMMFEEFSPGFYDSFYGNLSGFAHGRLHKLVFRMKIDIETKYQIQQGCNFNAQDAVFVLNPTIALMYGYLNLFEKFFPENTLKDDAAVYAMLIDRKQSFEEAMQCDKEDKSHIEHFYQYMDKLIYY